MPPDDADPSIMRVPPLNDRFVRTALLAALAALGALLFGCGEAPPEQKRVAAASAQVTDPLNSPPFITSVSLAPEAPPPGSHVRVFVEAEDAEGDPIKLTYRWTLAGESVGSGLPKLALQDGARGDDVEVTVVASDGRAESEPVTASAQLANRAPRIERLLIRPALEITAGTEVGVEAQVSDEDGDSFDLTYEWMLNGSRMPNTGPRFATNTLEKGDALTVEVLADDGSVESEPLVSPAIRVVNTPPRIVSQPRRSIRRTGFRYQVRAEDPDGDGPLLFSLEGEPAGMEIDAASGEVTWSPTHDQTGMHAVRIVVDDQAGGRIAHEFEVQVDGALGG